MNKIYLVYGKYCGCTDGFWNMDTKILHEDNIDEYFEDHLVIWPGIDVVYTEQNFIVNNPRWKKFNYHEVF